MTIHASEFVGPDDRIDAHAAIQTAINTLASENRRGPLLFDAPWNGDRVYRLLHRSRGGFRFPPGFRGVIEFDDRALLDFSTYGDVTTPGSGGSTGAKAVFNANGSLGDGRLLARNGRPGDSSLTLADGMGVHFVRNQDTLVSSDDIFTTMDSAAHKGERVLVDRIEGDIVHLKGDLRDLYRVEAKARLYPVNSVSLKVRNPRILGPGRPGGNFRGDRAISVSYGRDCLVEGGVIERCDMAAVDFAAVLEGNIRHVTVLQDTKGANNNEVGFCFLVTDGCDDVTLFDNSTYGGQQPYDISGSGELGIARRIKLISNRAKGAFSSAYALHDSQETILMDGNSAESCENGVDCRGGNVMIVNGRFVNLGTGLGNLGCGVQLRAKAVNIIIQRLYVSGALRGVWCKSDANETGEAPPASIQVQDSEFLGVTQRGMELRFAHHGDTFIPGVMVQRNHITAVGAARGIELGGRFLTPMVTDNVIDGDVGRSIYLNAGDGKTAGMGSESPLVRRNTYAKSMPGPLLHHVTGSANVGDNHAL